MIHRTKKTRNKYVPLQLLLPFFFLVLIFTISYGVGMKLNITEVTAGGFIGVICIFIGACNMCYRKGYVDRKMEANQDQDKE